MQLVKRTIARQQRVASLFFYVCILALVRALVVLQ